MNKITLLGNRVNSASQDCDAMTQTATSQKPLDRMLASFPDAHQRGNGWWTNPDNPHFDFLELLNGDIRIHSWTRRDDDDTLAMGNPPLTRAALYAKPGQASAVQNRDKLDLLTLAEYMCLPWKFMWQEGFIDEYTYTARDGRKTRCVKLGGICTPDGQEGKHQVRLSLHKEPRFLWNQNIPGEMLPSGLHYLDRARSAGYLIVGEGNSDWITSLFHGIPFIGIPGADQAKTLDVELVKDIPIIYIIEEPDQAKKLRETGQGFYKNMRQHLRDHGYQGEIFSIRFMEATGYKDPSDLHKAIYAACKEQAEGPFRQEVHKGFIQAIEQAIEQAVPEGNAGLFPVAKARDWSQITFEEFSKQVWAAPSEYLSPLQKMIVCYLFLYMREVEPDAELGWQVDADKMAHEVGLVGPSGKKKFLEQLSYLHQKVGIISKEHRAVKEYVNDPDEPEQVRYKGTDLYFRARPTYYTPRGYCVVTQDQHKPGGPREKEVVPSPKPTCINCGSENIDEYKLHHCLDCDYKHWPPDAMVEHRASVVEEDRPISVSASVEVQNLNGHTKVLSLEEPDLETQAREYAESFTIPEQQETKPETPILGYSENEQEDSYIESITVPQNGVFGTLFPSPAPAAPHIVDGLPTRMTICCNVPFQIGARGSPECSNPACPEKREVSV